MNRLNTTTAVLFVAGSAALTHSASAALITNGDLETAVTNLSSITGTSTFTVDGSDNVTENGNDTTRDVNEWVSTSLTKTFDWSATGGNGGTGGFVQDGATANGNARAVAFFARDDKATTGTVSVSIDIKLGQLSQFFSIELYAWDDGETAPGLSMGGPTSGAATYNVTALGGADTLLTATADTATLDTWQTISLGDVNLGAGHDYYAWRVGIVGADGSTTYAFDNLVAVVPEPGSLALMGLGGLLVARRRRG